jgi:tetratricopeptide (TPR) repeat protein
MNKNILLLFACLLSLQVFAQPSISDLKKTAKTLTKEGDYENATLVFNKILEKEPQDFEILKDFALLNYLKRDFAKSIEISKQLVEKPESDEACFQILGLNYKEILQYKDCEKMYKNGLLKFDSSGVLYNELGELYQLQKNTTEAIKQWEKGIERDPNYANNYFNAASFYSNNKEYFWTIVYGEIFINLESYTQRTSQMKEAVLDAYKKNLYLGVEAKAKTNAFEKEVLSMHSTVTSSVTVTLLTALRTKFILEWYFNKHNEKFAFRLFDQQRYLIREGLFDAYNQWIFGVASNPIEYTNWAKNHAKEIADFTQFQQARVFKLTTGQYYKFKN